jgi:hypothetical protein
VAIGSAPEDEGVVLGEFKLPSLHFSIHDFQLNPVRHAAAEDSRDRHRLQSRLQLCTALDGASAESVEVAVA